MNTKPAHGEIWFAELGMIEKGRPVLVLSYPSPNDARSLAIVAPLTSQIRGLRGEIDIGHPKWLTKPSAVNVQALASVDKNKLKRRFGKLPEDHLAEVKETLRELLEL